MYLALCHDLVNSAKIERLIIKANESAVQLLMSSRLSLQVTFSFDVDLVPAGYLSWPSASLPVFYPDLN